MSSSWPRKSSKRGVDGLGLLLLHPVPGAFDEHVAAVIGHPAVHDRGRAHEQDRIRGTADEQRRDRHLGAVDAFGQRPVAIEVAVPVDAAGEAGTRELGDVVVELGLRQPRGKGVGFRQPLDETAAVGCGCRADIESVFLGQTQSREHAPHRRRRIATEVRVGDAGLLEVEDVEERVAEHLAHDLDGWHRAAREERNAHAHDTGDAFRRQQRELPHDHRAPVVADEHRAFLADVVEEAEQVVREVLDVVVLDRVGTRRSAVPALIGCEHAVSGRRERGDLVAPRVRQLGEPVREHDRRSAPEIDDVEIDTVRRDSSCGQVRVGHAPTLRHRRGAPPN